MCGSREHINCDNLCSLFHHVVSDVSFSDWLTRRHAHSPYVPFTITLVADGVNEWTVSVTTSKRATSIADFLASPVRLIVSLTPFSVIWAMFIPESVASGETAEWDEQRVLPVEYGLPCGLSVHLRSSLLSSYVILAHCRTFGSEASPSFCIVCCIKVCLLPIAILSRSAVSRHFTQHCSSKLHCLALLRNSISDRLTYLLKRAEEIETHSEKIAFFLVMLFKRRFHFFE